MQGAHVDPNELRRFASSLRLFDTQLRESMQTLQGRFNQLGETWKDRKYVAYAQEFQQTMRALERFIESSEKQIAPLLEDADDIDEYLHRRR